MFFPMFFKHTSANIFNTTTRRANRAGTVQVGRCQVHSALQIGAQHLSMFFLLASIIYRENYVAKNIANRKFKVRHASNAGHAFCARFPLNCAAFHSLD